MSDPFLMHAADLPGIAKEAHQHELLRTLKDLQTDKGKNYAIYTDPDFTPSKAIAILPSPAVGPAGSKKICDGKLKIGANVIKVTAFRLA
jgi:hypothetical protein